MSVAPSANVNVTLSRINSQIPWGFRMSGGVDFSSPLTIQRVTPGTIASNSGVMPGDLIVAINGMHTGLMKHKDAQQTILACGNNISLGLSRDLAHLMAEPATAWNGQVNYIPSVKYKPNPKAAPPSPGHGDAYIAPGYAYQASLDSPQIPGFAPKTKDLPSVTDTKSTKIITAHGSRTSYSGSILNPQAANPTPVQRLPKSFAPTRPAAVSIAAAPVQTPPNVAAYPFSPKPAFTPSPLSPPIKQAAPMPWIPADGNNKVKDLPCGDSTAHRGISTYYSSAPLDPSKVPVCSNCRTNIRGPFIVALNKCWCPTHFSCAKCNSELINKGFVELDGKIYCENDYEKNFAPRCAKCSKAIMGDTVTALKETWHKECFRCAECGEPISTGAFHVEDGKPYCLNDWQRLFQTKCAGCNFPVEPGDRWIEALNTNWHSECFSCNVCNCPLEGKAFFARDGRPYCKGHAGAAAR
ncbi:PDZ and LIM domain protein 7-like isoform X1 [Watersipora subatra]|uniref:PDZ and LIM domain protein 7-like isoform X1 n=1 Tax=Watersipora subatra TaxID=2589382 RepID=UPI00355C3895